jgi:hypothetical protein
LMQHALFVKEFLREGCSGREPDRGVIG